MTSTHDEKFNSRTRREGDCLIWTGSVISSGYGSFRGDGEFLAHRYAWARKNGPIPKGMHIDHICWNRLCVSVDHLRLATRAQNAQNLSKLRSDNTSGYRGVYWHAAKGCWAACAKVNGKQKWRYGFASPEEAAVVAQGIRDSAYGEFAGARTPVSEDSARHYRKKVA